MPFHQIGFVAGQQLLLPHQSWPLCGQVPPVDGLEQASVPAPVPPPLEPPCGQNEGGLQACAMAVPLLSVAQHPVEHSKFEVQRAAHDPSVTRTVFEGHCVDAGGRPCSAPPHAPTNNTTINSRHPEAEVRAMGNESMPGMPNNQFVKLRSCAGSTSAISVVS